jgi:hypothetical protein
VETQADGWPRLVVRRTLGLVFALLEVGLVLIVHLARSMLDEFGCV